MTRAIQRSDVVDYQTYEDTRGDTRHAAMEMKKPRRIHLGDHLTLLFENKATLIYQIQEIMRAEKIARESAIEGEIEVYNLILGDTGELGAALLIEIVEEADRKPLLQRWLGLEKTIYVKAADGTKTYATYDESQVGEDRLSAVQYLKFAPPAPPVAVGTDFEDLAIEVELSSDQQAALAADLAAA